MLNKIQWNADKCISLEHSTIENMESPMFHSMINNSPPQFLAPYQMECSCNAITAASKKSGLGGKWSFYALEFKNLIKNWIECNQNSNLFIKEL